MLVVRMQTDLCFTVWGISSDDSDWPVVCCMRCYWWGCRLTCGLLYEVLIVRMQTDLWFAVSGVWPTCFRIRGNWPERRWAATPWRSEEVDSSLKTQRFLWVGVKTLNSSSKRVRITLFLLGRRTIEFAINSFHWIHSIQWILAESKSTIDLFPHAVVKRNFHHYTLFNVVSGNRYLTRGCNGNIVSITLTRSVSGARPDQFWTFWWWSEFSESSNLVFSKWRDFRPIRWIGQNHSCMN